ncbi:hypothetical protein sos41_32180 [Alphaproteobacteria bacterium SO-S41]|nr:hypothetical protein sos41_32180 [Alphaproteobacteria bacterium SO-S41]
MLRMVPLPRSAGEDQGAVILPRLRGRGTAKRCRGQMQRTGPTRRPMSPTMSTVCPPVTPRPARAGRGQIGAAGQVRSRNAAASPLTSRPLPYQGSALRTPLSWSAQADHRPRVSAPPDLTDVLRNKHPNLLMAVLGLDPRIDPAIQLATPLTSHALRRVDPSRSREGDRPSSPTTVRGIDADKRKSSGPFDDRNLKRGKVRLQEVEVSAQD